MILPEPDILELGERWAVAMARDFTMETRPEIPKLYEAYFASGVEIADAVDDALIGVSFDMDGQGHFRYGAGRVVSARPEVVSEGFEAVRLPAGEYAVFRHFGPVADLPVLFDRIFSEWLPASGWSVHGDPVVERYPEDARNGPDGMAFEIWAPVSR